jgi:hypothetical protein
MLSLAPSKKEQIDLRRPATMVRYIFLGVGIIIFISPAIRTTPLFELVDDGQYVHGMHDNTNAEKNQTTTAFEEEA